MLKICFLEKPYAGGPQEGVGIYHGALVHWTPKKVDRISLKRSVAIVARLNAMASSRGDGVQWDAKPYIAWLDTVARSLGSRTWGDC